MRRTRTALGPGRRASPVQSREVGRLDVVERTGDRQGLPDLLTDRVVAGECPVDPHCLPSPVTTGQKVPSGGIPVAQNV